jgi:hypothetical protein
VLIRLKPCREAEEELIETVHLALSTSILLSNGIRRGTCTIIVFNIGAQEYTIVADSDRVKMLSADLFSGTGLLQKLLRKGRTPGIWLIDKNGDRVLEKRVCLKLVPPYFTMDVLRMKRVDCLELSLPCRSELSYIIAFLGIILDQGLR